SSCCGYVSERELHSCPTRRSSDLGAALKKVPRPVLCYCRTGTRSATLWSLHEAKKRPLPEILASTKAAGYDMTEVARQDLGQRTDRKSTRLNSSHVKISYAVVCLK